MKPIFSLFQFMSVAGAVLSTKMNGSMHSQLKWILALIAIMSLFGTLINWWGL